MAGKRITAREDRLVRAAYNLGVHIGEELSKKRVDGVTQLYRTVEAVAEEPEGPRQASREPIQPANPPAQAPGAPAETKPEDG